MIHVDGCPFCEQAPDNGTDAYMLSPLNPVTPGHMLFIPTRHVEDAVEDPALTATVMFAACSMAKQNYVGDFNLITSVGAAATQTVRHLHIHMVPRTPGDGLMLPWTGQSLVRPVTEIGIDPYAIKP